MAIRHYRLVRNHLGSDRKECLQRNLRRDILYKKKKKERKKERRVTKSLAKDVGGSSVRNSVKINKNMILLVARIHPTMVM